MRNSYASKAVSNSIADSFESTERRQRIKHVIFVMKEFSIYARRPRERDGSGSSMSSTWYRTFNLRALRTQARSAKWNSTLI
jgi:hypothetical protein